MKLKHVSEHQEQLYKNMSQKELLAELCKHHRDLKAEEKNKSESEGIKGLAASIKEHRKEFKNELDAAKEAFDAVKKGFDDAIEELIENKKAHQEYH